MGDINVDTHDHQHPGFGKLSSFCDIFGLTNLVSSKTCFTGSHSSSIDVILTNRPRSFQATSVFETGLSDCHCFVTTTMKRHIPRLKPKKVKYRSYKNFNEDSFLADVRSLDFGSRFDDANQLYDNLTQRFRKVIDKHAPLKTRIKRGNSAPFMNRELSKAIYVRSNLKKKFNKNPSKENELKFKKQRNRCVSLRRKAIKTHFKKATENGHMSNKGFWNLVKPFLSNKGGLAENDIMLVTDEKIVTNELELSEIFNNHYVNIVEKTNGRKPTSLADTIGSDDDRDIVQEIVEKYKDHPSIVAIEHYSNHFFEPFSFQEVEIFDVWQLLRAVDCRKSTGEDQIPPRLLSLAGNELALPLTNAINTSIRESRFPENGKRAAVFPLNKGEVDQTKEKNFRPVSVLNAFSKIFEKVIKKQLMMHLDKTLSVFIAAYRKSYSTQHVLIRLVEDWRSKLDTDHVVGAVLMDLSKAFDCIPHDLLIAKLSAYGFDENSLVYIYSYLKRREQCVRINNTYSSFQTILSGVPQGSVLGPILFNFYINDLLLFIRQATVYNYADDNTLGFFSKNIPDLVKVLEEQSNVALDWLAYNEMIANPDKFHAIIVKKDRSDTTGINIRIKGQNIKTESTVKLLGVKLDYKLNFDPHISDLCKKAANQLNILKRLKRFIGFETRKLLVQSFVYSNFNYCPIVWHFSSAKSLHKVERIQERALRFQYDDHNSSYQELLQRSGRCFMHVSRLRSFCIEIYKTMKKLNPSFMEQLFQFKSSMNVNRSMRNPYDLKHHRPNQVTFGSNSLRSLGPQVWNSLSNEIKSAETLKTFKQIMKQWNGIQCTCNVCQYDMPLRS